MRVTIKQRARSSIRLKAISYSSATKADEDIAGGGTDNQRYMTALTTAQAAAAYVIPTRAIAIIDREEQDGRAKIVAEGVSFGALCTLGDLRRAAEARAASA